VNLPGGATIDSVANWADDYRRDHRQTGPWHYIDIPLADSRIDMARECANGDCVIGKTQQFLGCPERPEGRRGSEARGVRYMVHFVGDMHRPLRYRGLISS
jgi:hypothetical protein